MEKGFLHSLKPESSKELSAIVETIYGQGILSKSSEDVLKELFDINLVIH